MEGMKGRSNATDKKMVLVQSTLNMLLGLFRPYVSDGSFQIGTHPNISGKTRFFLIDQGRPIVQQGGGCNGFTDIAEVARQISVWLGALGAHIVLYLISQRRTSPCILPFRNSTFQLLSHYEYVSNYLMTPPSNITPLDNNQM